LVAESSFRREGPFRTPKIGLDSQRLSYLIDALEGVAPPTDGLAEQKVALVQLYLYTPCTLWVTPTGA
jgi:hypothetical protein